MKHTITILSVLLLLLSSASIWAGNERRIGTAGAQELRIPVGSRGVAMGSSTIANTEGVEAIYWNPAGLATLEGTEAMFTHLPYMADIEVNFGGIATSVEDFGTIAITAKVLSFGDLEETTEEMPNGTGRTFNPTYLVAGITYSRVLTANVQFGVTANVIHEDIFEVSATGMAFDIGFIYDPRWRGLKLGLAIKNYGPDMTFDGIGFERPNDEGRAVTARSAPFELPSAINIGMAYDFLEVEDSRMMATANFTSNNFSQDLWQGGVEYTYMENYSLRAGYNYSEQDNWVYGFSFGGGVKFDIGEASQLTLEYAWTETDVFDNNQFFTAKMNF